MLGKFIVVYVGVISNISWNQDILLEDKESTICGFVSWCLLHSPADSVLLYRTVKDGKQLVAVAEKKVQITLKQQGAADITKLI